MRRRRGGPRVAREDAGLTLLQAARGARISLAYLRRLERTGDVPYVLAVRLARLYRCSLHEFLSSSGGETPRTPGPWA